MWWPLPAIPHWSNRCASQGRRQGIEPKRIEGRSSAQWILMDYRDVIVHIFYAETRNFYSIDRVWADAPRLPLELEGEKK